MITELQIQNFKCFQQSAPFIFSRLNLLTGINGRGKSTLLQSLLILTQSARKDTDLKKMLINDELLQLGNYIDIKNSETPRSGQIGFHFKFDSPFINEIKIGFIENLEEPMVAFRGLTEVVVKDKKKKNNPQNKRRKDTNIELVHLFAEIIKHVHFVSADRLGPVKYVDKSILPEFVHVGPRGEHAISLLANSSNLSNVHKLLYRGNDADSVLQQTAEWLSYILDGAKIEIQGKSQDSSVLSILLNNRGTSYAYRQANVGFGYSYIIPLIVTGLVARVGDTIVVENPEAHLHPRAQSRIAEFFATVASCGIQVFIESHSEHILNGLRVSVLSPKINLQHQDLVIHYFNESFGSEVLRVDEKGKIANWPNGFFDQQEIDLANIFKLSR